MNLAVTTKQTRVRQYEFGRIRMPFDPAKSLAEKYRKLAEVLNQIRMLTDVDIPLHLEINPSLATPIARPYLRNVTSVPHVTENAQGFLFGSPHHSVAS